MLAFFFFLSGCQNPDTDTNTETDAGTETGTHTDIDTDAGTETGTPDVVGGNCGGPEPPPESLWECDEGAGVYAGPAWPTAGGPDNLSTCTTLDGWSYSISPSGLTVNLILTEEARELSCSWDGESYIE